jgi:hypothetical protein
LNSIKINSFLLHGCATEGNRVRISLQIVDLLAKGSLQVREEFLVKLLISYLRPQHPTTSCCLRVPAEEELVELFQYLFVGEQGLDELFLVGSSEAVEWHFAELLEGRVVEALVLVGAIENLLLHLLNAIIDYQVSPVQLFITPHRRLRCCFLL